MSDGAPGRRPELSLHSDGNMKSEKRCCWATRDALSPMSTIDQVLEDCRAAARRGDWAMALDVCRGGLARDGSLQHLHCFEGHCCTQLQLHSEAATAYSEALLLDAHSIPGLRGLVQLCAIAPSVISERRLCAGVLWSDLRPQNLL